MKRQYTVVSQSQLEGIQAIVPKFLSDDDPASQVEATTHLGKLLSKECPLNDYIIRSLVIPKFVEFLGRPDLPQVQLEATRTLMSVASKTSLHWSMIVDNGAVPMFVQLLCSSSDDVRELAVRALGNVVGDSPWCRDLVLGNDALVPLLALLNEQLAQGNTHSKLSIHATRTLLKFCEAKPPIPFDQVKPALPVLKRLIDLSNDEVLIDACLALSYLSDGPNDNIQAVYKTDVWPTLVKHLSDPRPAVLRPALCTIGNIVSGVDEQTKTVIIDNPVLSCLGQLLEPDDDKKITKFTPDDDKKIMKEACWIISNITAGNKNQIQLVIEANIINPLLVLLESAESASIKTKAAWAILNATVGGSNEQIRSLVNEGCIEVLCKCLLCPEDEFVEVCLEGLENILKAGDTDKDRVSYEKNKYAQAVQECGGLYGIYILHTSGNVTIYKKALKISETYFPEFAQSGNPEEWFSLFG